MNIGKWIILLVLSAGLIPKSPACQYNVRDIGFVDLDTEPYRLFCYVRHEMPAADVVRLRETADGILRETNLRFEIIDVDQQRDHPAMTHLKAVSTITFPTARLISPDGQVLPVVLTKAGKRLDETLTSALEGLVSSPTRDTILRTVSGAFGVVLFIPGEDVGQNTRGLTSITNAIEQIRGEMKALPKAIAEPPALIVLDGASLEREKVLLWSLGLETAADAQPRVALFYGRARWIGPLMKGVEIAERNVAGIFSLLGADCECGLDISWTQGTRLPVRWSEALHGQVTRALGFDPESPLVKIEASRIVGMRGSPRASGGNNAAAMSDRKAEATDGAASRRDGQSSFDVGSTASADFPRATPEASRTEPVLRVSFVFLGGMTLLVLFTGLWIWLRSAGKH